MTAAVAQGSESPAFSLLGGPLHRLGRRLGLVSDGGHAVRLGLAIGGFLWAVLVVVSLFEGLDPFAFYALNAHVRLLAVIPLLFLCESLLDPRAAQFMRAIRYAGIVPRTALPEFNAMILRARRWQNGWLPDALCLTLAVALTWALPLLQLPGFAVNGLNMQPGGATLAGAWYTGVCLTVLRFLLLRWVWRLALWLYCLWQLSRLPLQLRASHPDGVAGLGFLEVVHVHFLPLVFAISLQLSVSFAADIHAGTMSLEAVYPALFVILLVDGLLFVAPLFVFSPKLWACRVQGLRDYMEFAERYVVDFESKWLRRDAPPDEPLLGTADIQSLTDLGGSVERVRDMRFVPVSANLLIQIAVAALLPLLPLVLFRYPITELAQELLSRLAGR